MFSGHERHVVSLNEYSFSPHGEHSVPFPIYPGLHMQLKLPTVLIQFAWIWQLWVSEVHSSISIHFNQYLEWWKKNKKKIKTNIPSQEPEVELQSPFEPNWSHVLEIKPW